MTGADTAQSQPQDGIHETAAEPQWLGRVAEEPQPELPAADDSGQPKSAGARVVGALLVLLALAWIAALGWTLWQVRPAPTVPNAVLWSATASAPLALLALLWLLLGRTSRRETERFTRAVEAMRTESNALESVLGIVATRLEENHARLRGEAEKLMSLGDEASDRLGRVTYYLSKETASLDRKAAELESAAAAAKVDIGVLMHDLPRAEEQARAVADAMKDAGLTAHGQAGALEAQLAALSARGREADEVLGSAAQRMGAHVARIESTAATAAASMSEASTTMTAAVDGAMARASEALEAARGALDVQSGAMLAAIEQSRAALDRAGEDAAHSLSQRLDAIGGQIETLAGQLAAQDEASHKLVTGLGKELAELDGWFEQLGRTGGAQAERLRTSVGAVRETAQALIADFGTGTEGAGALVGRARELSEALVGVSAQLEGQLPGALDEVEARAGRAGAAVSALGPMVESVHGSAQSIEARMAGAGARVEQVASMLAAQDEASRALVDGLVRDVATLQDSFTALEQGGSAQTSALGGAIATLRGAAADLERELAGGGERAAALNSRAGDMAATLRDAAARLDQDLPAALGRVEEQAARTALAASALAPVVEGLEGSAGRALAGVGEAEASIARQRESLDALLERIDSGSAGAEERLRGLGAAAAEAQEAAARIASDTGPELIEALLRVREAASQAAERAREAISAVIPSSAAALGEAGREALVQAIEESVGAQMTELSALAERSVQTARAASERLTRQMLTLGETTAAIENRIDSARREREEKDSEGFSRRVALLIESLNSTAIDVTKILSNDVTDSAWSSYLKGDRGVFTRRAVRLLDTTEAREIVRHYEEEPEFREQVNRYIHDFEAMLRRVLADRDGSPLGITILSSDMGKLYVALAQAIERLRA
jgi:hypothetical protein